MMTTDLAGERDLLDEIVDAGLEDRERAARAVRATVAAIAERLTLDEARRLAKVLPDELQPLVVPRGSRAGAAEVVDDVRRLENVSSGRAREEIQIVCGVLGRRLGDGDRQVVIRALPAEIAADFERPVREAPESLPPTLPSGTGRTLATGRAGSRHPIAEAAPERAHSESIARSDDPHGDTKLSSAEGFTQEREGETLAKGRAGPGRPLAEANERMAPSQR